jgi:hypothetical protein
MTQVVKKSEYVSYRYGLHLRLAFTIKSVSSRCSPVTGRQSNWGNARITGYRAHNISDFCRKTHIFITGKHIGDEEYWNARRCFGRDALFGACGMRSISISMKTGFICG